MTELMDDRRRELLRARLTERGLISREFGEPGEDVLARAEAGPLPLSQGQRRLWFVQTRDPADITLNIGVAYALTGPVDAAALQRAIAAVVWRHEPLRTSYHLDETGEPYQRIHRDRRAHWAAHDLTTGPEAERAAAVQMLARREFGHRFDLAEDALLRVTLVRTGTDEHVLIVVVHHICWDEESWAVFFGELTAVYGTTGVAPLGARYADVTATSDAAAADRDAAFWRETLAPPPPPLELPGRHGGVQASSPRSDRCVRRLPLPLRQQVNAVAAEHGATPFMLLFAAFQYLLARYTSATDFLVAVPTTLRASNCAGLIGYFGNTLLLRSALAGARTVQDLLTAVRETCTAGFAHPGAAVDKVVRELNPDRSDGRDGFAAVRVSFSARTAPAGLSLPGLQSRLLDLRTGVAQHPLGMTVAFDAEGAVLELEHQVEVLDRSLAEQLSDAYLRLVEIFVADPNGELTGVDLLGPAQTQAMLAACRGRTESPAAGTLADVVVRRCVADPHRIALVTAAGQVSYEALHRRANRMARAMISRGIGPDDVVAIVLADAAQAIPAMLAVLLAGAAYVPIDPAYPAVRIEYLLADADPSMVLDADSLAELESIAAQLPAGSIADAERVRPLRPGNLAYVIYTSGSTGAPKGVPVPHSAVVDHLAGVSTVVDFVPDDCVVLTSSTSFDATILEIFGTLAAGARLVIPKPSGVRDIGYLAALVHAQQATVMHMVPSLLRALLLLPDAGRWTTLRCVPVGGEALPGELADAFAMVFDARLSNNYGPTEAVVAATNYPVVGPQGGRTVPIGTPNRNVRVYLLDSALRLVPPGVVGEIYIGGGQLARGYLSMPAATALAFPADPFSAGARMYRTGDLARRSDAGELEFVGRADEQVAIRGYRVELAEVQAVVAAHPRVAQCVVVAVDHAAAGVALAAYVVPAGDGVDTAALREFVAQRLPTHMVPSWFPVIEQVPVTVHGKLDRAALPVPTDMPHKRRRAPATPTQGRVAQLFSALFRRDDIGLDDSFFELGGHSLLAARLVTLMGAEFGIDFDVRTPFDAPTVAALAALVVARMREEFGVDLDTMADDGTSAETPTAVPAAAPLVAYHDDGPAPLSYSQLAMWFQQRLLGPSPLGNLRFAVRLTGELDIAALQAAVADVVSRHAALRTAFGEQAGVPYQLVRDTVTVAVPVTDLSDEAEAWREALDTQAQHCFAIESEVLVRPHLLALGERNYVLSLVFHHMVADHRACALIFADLATAYRARRRGVAPSWELPRLRPGDHARWQHAAFDDDTAAGPSLDYWRTALAGLPDEIAVAHDHARPVVLGTAAVVAQFSVPAQVRQRHRALGSADGTSEFMTCLAAMVAVLHRLGGGTDIAVGTPTEGCTEQTADLVGLLANMVVLRVDLSGGPSLREVLRQCRTVTLDAFNHQEAPIERVVDALNPPRRRSRNPLFQVMLHLHEPPPAQAVDTDLVATTLPVVPEIAFLDINIHLRAEAEGGFVGTVILNRDLYDHATAGLMAAALADTLAVLAANPDTLVTELDIAAPAKIPTPLAAHAGGSALTQPDEPSPTEQSLIAILEELLGISGITGEDGFFALGGDSVMSLQWAARARAEGLALTPQLVFEHFTVAELAAAVDAAAPSDTPASPEPEGAQAQSPQQFWAPMSASGLSPEELAALTAAWRSEQ